MHVLLDVASLVTVFRPCVLLGVSYVHMYTYSSDIIRCVLSTVMFQLCAHAEGRFH
jgi:hypothetical protein